MISRKSNKVYVIQMTIICTVFVRFDAVHKIVDFEFQLNEHMINNPADRTNQTKKQRKEYILHLE